MKYHEKEIDQKELNLFEFSVKYQNENNYEQFIQKIKSSIFPDVKANNFWENIAERSNVIDCVNELREYENNLKFYHEKQKTYKEIIQSELETLQEMKNSLKVREEKCSILDVQLEKLGLEKLHNERVLVDILNANKEMSEKINRLDNQMSNPQKNVNSAILELN